MIVIQVDFSADEVFQLRDMSLNHPHYFVRCKALALLLKSEAIAHWQIAKLVGICENTLRDYLNEYKEKGIESIAVLNFRKPESALYAFQDKIKEYFEKTPPASLKQACTEIAQLTGVTLRETQMGVYVKKLGVKFRKVAGIPAKADSVKQAEFLENQLDPRLQEAENGIRTVYFMDAAHFVLSAFLGYLWSFSRVFVKTPSGRQRFNVLGALDATTKELLTITNTTYITAIQVCELLDLIAKKAMNPVTYVMHPVTIVLDNSKYQRCKMVIDKAESLGIELLFLPPYSPNLNLIERLWKFTKKNCLNSKYYSDFALFKNAISSFLSTMNTTHATSLKSLLTLNFQTFESEQNQQTIY
jgi:transposase